MSDLINVSSSNTPVSVTIDTGTPKVNVADLSAVTRIIINKVPVAGVYITDYQNDFTLDPVGPFDIANSDVISDNLSYTLFLDNPDYAGVISQNIGLINGPLQTVFVLNGIDFGGETTMTSEFILPDNFESLVFGFKASLVVETGMIFSLQPLAGALQITTGNPTVNTIITAAPSTNWANKIHKVTVIQTGNNLNIVVTADGIEIYSEVITYPEYLSDIFIFSFNKCIMQNMYITQ